MPSPRRPASDLVTASTLNRAGLLGALLLAALTCACGGNGTATSTGSGFGTPSTASTCNLPALQSQLLTDINQLRAQARSCNSGGSFGATAAVSWNDKLFTAATAHNTDMATRNYFNHDSPEGVSMDQRVTAAGYAWSAVAENIGFGQADVAAILATWIASDGHCANIMNPVYREVGLSCVRSASGTNFWTMNLASP